MKKIGTTYFLLFAGVLSLTLFSLLFYKRIRLLMHSYEMVNRSTQVYLQADRLFLSLRDATVEYRNYLRTGDTASILDINRHLDDYARIASSVEQLEQGHKRQLANIRQVNQLATAYISDMRRGIDSVKLNGLGYDDFDENRRDMAAIRTAIDSIISTENAIRKRRDTELSHTIYTTPLFLLTFSLLSLAATTYAFFTILKQVKRSRAIELSEAKFKLLIKHAPVAIAILKGEEAMVDIVNDKALSIINGRQNEVVGHSLFELIPGTLRTKEAYRKLLAEGKPVTQSEFKVPLQRQGKEQNCYFDFVIEPLFDSGGVVNAAIAVASETTEKVLAYRKVQESEKHFRALIENSLDVIILSDANGVLTYCSPSVSSIFGYTEQELPGRTALELVHPDDIPQLVESAEPMVQHRHKLASTVRFLHKDGSWRWVESTVSNMLGVPYINAFVCNIHDITEQKKAQDTLKQSEENFRQLADLIPQIVWTAKTDGFIDYYNKRWYEYNGLDDVFGVDKWAAVLHEDDLQRSLDTWHHSVVTGEPYRIEYRFRDRATPGAYRWFLGKALPIRDEAGNIIKWFGTCTDIHDQKTLTEKLEQLVEERTAELTARNKDLSEAQRLAHIGSWEWDIVEDKIYWSEELYKVYGIDPADFQATFENYLSLVHPDDRPYVQKMISDAYANKEAFDFFHRIKTPEGLVRTLHARGKVYTDAKGNAIRMKGTGQDISQTVAIQNKIADLNQTFNFAEQTSCIGSVRYNFATGEFTCSDNLYRLLGCEPGAFEPSFTALKSFVHPEDVEGVEWQVKALNEASAAEDRLFRVVQTGGTVVHIRSTGMFIHAQKERIYIGALQDVTVQHNKELQLLDQNNALEKMNSELASFSYIASHDLQEPLRKIRTFTKRLHDKEAASLSPEGQDLFRRIENAATRMQQLIVDLLSYSRTNAVQPQFEPADMNKVLQEVLESLSEKIAQTHTVVEADTLGVVPVIQFQVQQLFTNLITNSIKFCRKGVPPHIRITHEVIQGIKHADPHGLKNEKYVRISFADNGIGFDPQYNEQVFGLFQRLHGRNEFEGTGIGLAICKKIVENHNGCITANGRAGEGATFHIFLPLQQAT